MRNREFVFTPKIEYELVAERSEANQNSFTFPFWYPGREGGCRLLTVVLGKYSSELDIYTALLVRRTLCSIPNKLPKTTNQEG